ncbi:MAG: leucine-rich repeat protein, partial [Paludibacteraceae bacterium]|nr:leucine-rich repeat protein [Paludibacteraceae bacterium]
MLILSSSSKTVFSYGISTRSGRPSSPRRNLTFVLTTFCIFTILFYSRIVSTFFRLSQSIGDYAFQNCSELTSVEIPENLVYIGQGAFFGCSNI